MRGILVLSALLLATPAFAQAPADDRLSDVEKKLDAAIAEIERLKLSGTAAPDTATTMRSRYGFGPAASRVYGIHTGPSLGGYGEALFESPDGEREDGTPSGAPPRADLLRAVFYVGYKFAPTLVFNSEIEFEHAGISDEAVAEVDPTTHQGVAELTGEVVMEFAYLDWMARPWLGVRTGKVLVPMGIVNEQHEPPTFYATRRPDTERFIIPTTWASVGAGLFGATEGGLEWRAYLVDGLDASHFSASSGVRSGRQSGSQALMTHPGFTARADWKGVPGLVAGVSGFTGDSWQQPQPGGTYLSARVTITDVHALYNWRGLDVRGLYAAGSLDQAGELSDALGLTGGARLGERFWGGYVEGGYDLAPVFWPGASWALSPYLRAEKYDTQDSVPGGAESDGNEHTVMMFGVAVKPHPNVVLKADREQRSNPAETETSRWNVALGWLF